MDTIAEPKQDVASDIHPPQNDPGIPTIPGYLSKAQAAAYINKSDATLDRWNRLRVGPPRTKLGSSVYYREAALKAWLVTQEQASLRNGR